MENILNIFTKDTDEKIFYRVKNSELEQELSKRHTVTLKQVSIPLGKDLALRTPCLPEPDCESDNFTGEIQARYSNDLRYAKMELQARIQPEYIDSENILADKKLQELTDEKSNLENERRIKNSDAESCDLGVLKKGLNYNFGLRPLNALVVLLDMFLSSQALQNIGISSAAAYGIGFVIGVGIFFIAENLPDIILKGRSWVERWLIATIIFAVLSAIFLFLGKQRVVGYVGTTLEGSDAIRPIYFASMNMFMTLVVVITAYFGRPTKAQRDIINRYKQGKDEVKRLTVKVKILSEDITKLRAKQSSRQLFRKQITEYERYIYELIQGYFEESIRAFESTNRRYRRDGITPKFFGNPIKPLAHNNVESKNTNYENESSTFARNNGQRLHEH